VLARPWARVVLFGVFAEGFAMFGAFSYIGADLHHRFSLGFGSVGLIMGAYGLGGMIYAWSARRLLARLGERGLVAMGAILIAGGYGALVLAPVPAFAFAAILVLGLGYWSLHNTLQTNATQMAPEQRGTALSMFASCFFMGQSLGVALAAPVVDGFGPAPVYLVGAALLVAAAVWFRGRLAWRM
jgi:MFS transporter, YNFM family, putative membrane transport protein